MRAVVSLCCAVVLIGCSRPDQQSSSGSSVAGTWRIIGFNEAGDSIVAYQLVATADTAGWQMTLPNRASMPVRVLVMTGDSIVTEAGPYESVLRPGVQVRTHSVIRLRGDSLVGTTVARYSPAGADSVLRVRNVGTRIP